MEQAKFEVKTTLRFKVNGNEKFHPKIQHLNSMNNAAGWTLLFCKYSIELFFSLLSVCITITILLPHRPTISKKPKFPHKQFITPSLHHNTLQLPSKVSSNQEGLKVKFKRINKNGCNLL